MRQFARQSSTIQNLQRLLREIVPRGPCFAMLNKLSIMGRCYFICSPWMHAEITRFPFVRVDASCALGCSGEIKSELTNMSAIRSLDRKVGKLAPTTSRQRPRLLYVWKVRGQQSKV